MAEKAHVLERILRTGYRDMWWKHNESMSDIARGSPSLPRCSWREIHGI